MLLSLAKQICHCSFLRPAACFFLLFGSQAHALETIFITGFTPTVGADTDSVVLMSTNGGTSWTLQNSVFGLRETRSIAALNSSNYFAVGGTSGVNPTGYTFSTSGGAQSVSSGLLQSVDVAAGTYYAAGATTSGNSGTILKSTDGTNWTTQVSSGPKLYGVSASSASVAYAVGASGTVQKTTDGTNWSSQTTDSNYVLYGVDTLNATTAYAVGKNGSDGVILKTTNGTTWSTAQTVSSTPLNAVSVAETEPNTAFAVGDGSVIMKTTDGITWADTGFSSNIGGALSSIYAVSSTNAYAVGVIGTVAKLNGSGWSDISINIPVEYQGYNFTGVSVFTTIPVPEPSTIALSVAAVSVLAIMHRARKTAPKRI